jgi:hypothetical protein
LLRGELRAHIKALYLVIGNLSTITPGGSFVVLKIAGHHLVFIHFPSVGARSPSSSCPKMTNKCEQLLCIILYVVWLIHPPLSFNDRCVRAAFYTYIQHTHFP